MPNNSIIIARDSTFSDLPIDLTIHPKKNDIIPKKGPDAIKQSIKNLLLTNYGERPFNRFLGSNLTEFLFENINAGFANEIRDRIFDLLDEQEPRIQTNDVKVFADPSNNGYGVEINYSIIGQTENEEVQFFLNRIR